MTTHTAGHTWGSYRASTPTTPKRRAKPRITEQRKRFEIDLNDKGNYIWRHPNPGMGPYLDIRICRNGLHRLFDLPKHAPFDLVLSSKPHPKAYEITQAYVWTIDLRKSNGKLTKSDVYTSLANYINEFGTPCYARVEIDA